LVPYLGAGVGVMSAVALLNRAGPEQSLNSLIGYGLGTVYLAYMPFIISSQPSARSPATAPKMTRSTPWLIAGGASLVGLVVLGVGVGDLGD
jgi:hypothetical protein